MTRRCIAVAALVLLLVLPGSLLAQIATTSLRGVVKDPSGALVPGAKITITNNATGQSLTATSNGAGEYSFTQIAPARYMIDVTAAGFGEQKARIFLALLGKQYSVTPKGWRAAAGEYGKAGTHLSVADIADAGSLEKVRSYKKQLKAKGKAGT